MNLSLSLKDSEAKKKQGVGNKRENFQAANKAPCC